MKGDLRLSFLKRAGETSGSGTPMEFSPDTAVTIGRLADSAVHLNDPHVSRRHAQVNCVEGHWTLVDYASRLGTSVNGTTLKAQDPCWLAHGDLIGIGPYLLRVDLGGESITLLQDVSPEASGEVELIGQDELHNLAGIRLSVLLKVAAQLQEASDEKTLASTAANALLEGTGFGRAMVLRGHDVGSIEVLARQTTPQFKDAEARISRTLMRTAAQGMPARLGDGANADLAQSIVSEGVTAAMCIPIFLGASIEGFFYLDSTVGVQPGNDAAAFVQALGKFVAMGLGEIRRRDLADRQLQMNKELSAAHAVQRRLIPPDRGSLGPWRWKLHCEPGRVVAGDIIGAGQSADGFWFFLGDVAGKGMGAGMMMASIQAFLSAELERGHTVLEAMNSVNSYVCRHRSQSEFATLMAMCCTSDGRLMRMVDAGHGMGAIARTGSPATLIQCDGGPPVGVLDEAFGSSEFQLLPGDRILLFSDGVCEQRNADGVELGIQRVLECLTNSQDESTDVECVMNLLRAHAAGAPFADDVSVASVVYAADK